MLADSRRFVPIVVLLLIGIGVSWGQRLSLAARFSREFPSSERDAPADAATVETSVATPVQPEYIYFLDVEGWYRITPYETVVRSPYDLTGDSTDAIAAALPSRLGKWRQVGTDRNVADDPAIVYYLRHPTVALQRTYQHDSGRRVTLGIIGNKGDDSFLLFSHTPETCYPGLLYEVIHNQRESALLGDRPMHAQYLMTQHKDTGQRLMVLFWYLWENPERDSRDGVLSVRVNLFLSPEDTEEEALADAWDFVRTLFPSAVPWDRF